jgi:hypothetical protein
MRSSSGRERKNKNYEGRKKHFEYNFNVLRGINFVDLIGTPQGRSSINRVDECIRTDPWANIVNQWPGLSSGHR